MLAWALLTVLGAEPGAWLQLDHCTRLDEHELRELTELELSAPLDTGTAVVRCEPEAFVVTVRTEEQEHQRRVSKTTVGDAPERYLAVELAELFESSRAAPVPAPSVSPPPTAEPEAPPEPPARPWGWVAAGARFELAGGPAAPAAGGSVSVGGRLWRWLGLRAELLGLGGARQVAPDRVRTTFLGGMAVLSAMVDAGPVEVHAGAGARVGERWIHGISRSEGVTGYRHHGTTWSPVASLGVLVPVRRRAMVMAQLDAGWVVRPVRGFMGQQLVFSSGGPWFGVSFAGGFQLGS